MKYIKKIINKISSMTISRFDDQCIKLLEKEIVGSCDTLLDIGCGHSSPIQRFSSRLRYSVGIDCYEPYLLESRKAKIHHEYKLIDALQIENHFKAKQFDCVLASDLIEHLSKENGLELIIMMERIAKKKVILFTPNGFVPQGECDSNPYEVHLSGWEIGGIKRLGFNKIVGVNGWKLLRKEKGFLRWRPVLIWNVISLLTQVITNKYPKYAFNIFCVKDL